MKQHTQSDSNLKLSVLSIENHRQSEIVYFHDQLSQNFPALIISGAKSDTPYRKVYGYLQINLLTATCLVNNLYQKAQEWLALWKLSRELVNYPRFNVEQTLTTRWQMSFGC